MSKKETFEVTAYPIGSTIFTLYDDKVLEVEVSDITISANEDIEEAIEPSEYRVYAGDGLILNLYADTVFSTKQELLNSL